MQIKYLLQEGQRPLCLYQDQMSGYMSFPIFFCEKEGYKILNDKYKSPTLILLNGNSAVWIDELHNQYQTCFSN